MITSKLCERAVDKGNMVRRVARVLALIANGYIVYDTYIENDDPVTVEVKINFQAKEIYTDRGAIQLRRYCLDTLATLSEDID
jgi:hypothetical protein